MSLFGGLAGIAVDAMARPATRIRPAAGAYVDGQWQAGASVSTAIRAVIQAPAERDLRLLPEGERTEAYVTVWTRADLRTGDEDSRTEADRVTGEAGDTYKIVRIVQRTEAGFTRVHSVVDGFEGDMSPQGRRSVNGWKNAGLPWTYRLERSRMYFPR